MTDSSPVSNPFAAFGSLAATHHFSRRIDGTYGSFATAAGDIFYLQTKARIAGTPSPYTDLTRVLVPVREASNVRELDFNQLLQRDLDDHRIVTKLIPYIIKPPSTSLPAFFPPIVAMVLPFSAQGQPEDYFPAPSEETLNDSEYHMTFRAVSHGRAFRVQYLVDQHGQPSLLPFAVLRWNEDAAKIVIIDGQHRAMALLAIERTLNNSWNATTNGAKYEPFYREEVTRLIQGINQTDFKLDPSRIELPVTICWIPESPGNHPRPRPHRVARKLFVDVNDNARPPSEARLILLSDTELLNIFARELLNRLRTDEWKGRFPLYAVEYDNPKKGNTTPRRWSVLTNLEILRHAVLRCVFGPSKLITDMNHGLSGKPNWRDMNLFMHQQLQIGTIFPSHFHDGPRPMEAERLSNTLFPSNDPELLKKLLDKFYERWGKGILHLLSSVEPWRAHLDAIAGLRTSWTPGDNIQALAKDALFEGVGMFWTLEDGHELWSQQRQEAQKNQLPEPPQPDVSRAWNILEGEQSRSFRRSRAQRYLHKDGQEQLDAADDLYRALNTYAAQVGLILAWVSVQQTKPEIDPYLLAETFVKCLNRSITTGPVMHRDRRLIFLTRAASDDFKPFNSLPKLDTPFAVYFRYFWLELLLLFPENKKDLEAIGLDLAAAQTLCDKARQHYLALLVAERKRIRRRDPDLLNIKEKEQPAIIHERALADVVEEQGQAHKFWFGTAIADARAKIRSALDGIAFSGVGDADKGAAVSVGSEQGPLPNGIDDLGDAITPEDSDDLSEA